MRNTDFCILNEEVESGLYNCIFITYLSDYDTQAAPEASSASTLNHLTIMLEMGFVKLGIHEGSAAERCFMQ